MILVDTTILVYAVGAHHPLRDACRRVIAAIGDGRLAATTTIESIQEFAHVRAKRRGRRDARDLALSYIHLLSPLTQVDGEDLTRGLELFTTHDDLGSFDAVLAATVLRRDHLVGLVSTDRGFGSVEGLHHMNPMDESAVDALIEA